MGKEKRTNQASGGALRYAGAGVELAATVIVACLLGFWIDRRFGTEPWGLVILAVVGVVGGLYNLVRHAVLEMFQPPDGDPSRRGPTDEGPGDRGGRTER